MAASEKFQQDLEDLHFRPRPGSQAGALVLVPKANQISVIIQKRPSHPKLVAEPVPRPLFPHRRPYVRRLYQRLKGIKPDKITIVRGLSPLSILKYHRR